MKIVIPDDFPPVYQGHAELEPLKPYGEVVPYSTKAASEDELIQRLAHAEAVINIRAYTVFDARVLAALPRLRLISILGTGTDNIDLGAATAHGVVVVNTPGASTVSVAELTLALMLAAARFLPLADRKMRQGEWHHREGQELRGKTLGVVGLGAIGQEVARMARALGLNVIGWSLTHDPARAQACGVELVERDELWRRADIVSLHLRLSPDTKGLLGRRELALMKPTAILVNTARGALVDQEALVEALRERRIAAAGLDTFPQEPVPTDNPLLELDNVVLAPHIGWVTAEAAQRLRQLPVDNIIAYLEGRPQFVVNPAALGHPKQARP